MPNTRTHTPSLRELDHRRSSGLDITLYWDPSHEGPLVSVSDSRSGDYFVLRPHKSDALDAFRHPYGYAARQGADISAAERNRTAAASQAGGR